MEKIFNTVFPPKCIACKSYGRDFCYSCMQKCRVLAEGFCLVCDKPSIYGKTHYQCLSKITPISIFSPFIYVDLVRDCIRRSKYNQMEFAALRELTLEGCTFAQKAGVTYAEDYLVVPVPLSRNRYKERGFNQSTVIGKAVANSFKLKFSPSLLIRIKETQVQSSLNRKERSLNVSNVFKAAEEIKGKNILLIDDISTTGATFLSTSKTILEKEAKSVYCFALSKKL